MTISTFPFLTQKTYVWEYEDDGWHPLASQSQTIVESAYLAYKRGASSASTQIVVGDMWTREVDFDTMRQQTSLTPDIGKDKCDEEKLTLMFKCHNVVCIVL